MIAGPNGRSETPNLRWNKQARGQAYSYDVKSLHTARVEVRIPRMQAVLWCLCVQFFVAEQIARLGWTLPYSFARNYISDLGATVCTSLVCSPRHALMNASFVLQGLLIAGGRWRAGVVPQRLRASG